MGLTADNFWFDGLVRSGGQAANRKIRDKEELKMKVKTNTVLVVVALLTYWIGLCNTHAYYDPRMQRWLNRDP
jgi:hypothetical protein